MTDSPRNAAGTDNTPVGRIASSSLGELADAVAAAARSVPGVADLHTGVFGEVATYLPGRRVNGVRIREDVTEVHLTLIWGAPVLPTAEEVRRVVAALVTTRVDITVEDVVAPRSAREPEA
ncbi:hypothetical protein V3N99_19710 [Dermatophilaceae bacterium Soc4.6]